MLKANIRTTIAVLGMMVVSAPAMAQDLFSITVDESYEDVLFALENTIVDRGLNIDTISHVGEMLARTGEDLGEEEALFDGATIFNFCSARFSRDAMSLNRANIRYCPYGIFVYADPRNPGQTVIGHQIYLSPDMAAVNALLDEIVTEASLY